MYNSLSGQINNAKTQADLLVNDWNQRFDSDQPKLVEDILDEDVNMISGSEVYRGRAEVMDQFVKARMNVVTKLKAVNEFFSASNDIIFTAGRYSLTVNIDSKEPYEAIGNYTFIWRKNSAGKFKIIFMHTESVARK